jgi:hypothetical protein
VDQYLLENLRAARDLLCHPAHGDALDRDVAHAFLGRSLFTCYLLERGIIGSKQLQAVRAPVERTLWEVLDKLAAGTSPTAATDVLFNLFRLLHEDFNGSMFADKFATEREDLRPQHLEVLQRFLRGDDLKARQPTLGFGLYDFRLIPIELISSIYESFLAAEDDEPDEQEELQTDYSKTERRQAGAYYTPPRLAELVVDIATQGWDTFLDKRCLDPACGSGVFLVILFQRMAEEWRRKNPNATNVQRALALRQLLTENLCGVDRNETACLVACFSLYLAFMDQFEPPDIWALRDELVRRRASQKAGREERVLPPLMPDADEAAAGAKTVIHANNFFARELDQLGPFHLVIGNPPWFGRQQSSDEVMRAWLFSERNPFLKDAPAKEGDRKAQFLPSDQSAIGFMWKAPVHARKTGDGSAGRVCLLVPSRVFLANKTDKFQAAWFQQFRVETLWQLADFRFILFQGSDCPASVVRYVWEPPATEPGGLAYVVPKVQRSDPREAAVFVLPEDEKSILQTEVVDAARQKQAFVLWKKHFWGTPRDVRFLGRLMRMPKLGDNTGRPQQRKRFNKGQGFQPFDEASYRRNPKGYGKPKTPWWGEDHLFVEAEAGQWNLVLLESDCRAIGKQWSRLRRRPEKALFQPPLVVFNKGCTKFAFSDFPVLFRHALQSITGRSEDTDLLLLLVAVLNCPVATYFFFHASANVGVERDTVLLDEYLRLPFPMPEDTRKPNVAADIARRVADLLRQLKGKLESPSMLRSPLFLGERERLVEVTKKQLMALVLDYYELNSRERVLIDDTLRVCLESSTPASIYSDIPTLRSADSDQRRAYADYFCRTINTWAHRSSEKIQAVGQICSKSGLCLLSITRSSQPKPYVERPHDADFEAVLKRIGDAAQEKYPGITYLRGFFLIEDEAIHVLKPLAYRHWTRTAALNDADEVMGELMFLKAAS